jgi:thiol-disulfide isomerase/thioredoxin
MKKILFLLLLPIFAASLVACQEQTTTTTVNFELFEQIDRYQDVFTRREGTYLVYVYSDTCVNCQAIKQRVYDFANEYTGHTIYFFNAALATDAQTQQQAYIAKIGQTQVQTPSLVVVVDNDFDLTMLSNYYFMGAATVLNVLDDIQNGAYVPFQ